MFISTHVLGNFEGLIFSPGSSDKCDQEHPLQSLPVAHHLLPPVHWTPQYSTLVDSGRTSVVLLHHYWAVLTKNLDNFAIL